MMRHVGQKVNPSKTFLGFAREALSAGARAPRSDRLGHGKPIMVAGQIQPRLSATPRRIPRCTPRHGNQRSRCRPIWADLDVLRNHSIVPLWRGWSVPAARSLAEMWVVSLPLGVSCRSPGNAWPSRWCLGGGLAGSDIFGVGRRCSSWRIDRSCDRSGLGHQS